jgi:hypothetical protein
MEGSVEDLRDDSPNYCPSRPHPSRPSSCTVLHSLLPIQCRPLGLSSFRGALMHLHGNMLVAAGRKRLEMLG